MAIQSNKHWITIATESACKKCHDMLCNARDETRWMMATYWLGNRDSVSWLRDAAGGGSLGCRVRGWHSSLCSSYECCRWAMLRQITDASQHGRLTQLSTHLTCEKDNGILVDKNCFSYLKKFSETRGNQDSLTSLMAGGTFSDTTLYLDNVSCRIFVILRYGSVVVVKRNTMSRTRLLSTEKFHSLPFIKCLSYHDCLEDKREDYQNCSVLYCVTQLCTVVGTLIWAVRADNLF